MEEVFERILQGQPLQLTQPQLLQFEGYCSARTFPLPTLITAATAIFKIDADLAQHFLLHLQRQELPKSAYNDFNHQQHKIAIYNYLTGLFLSKAAREEGQKERQKLMAEARKYLSSGEKVRMTVDKSIILNRALLHLYGGESTKALNLVTRINEQIHRTGEGKHLTVTVMLVLAQIHFHKKNYGRALDLYKKILATAKRLPARGRLGMAYSFFYLGKYEMARACFKRLLELEPRCVEALVGIATVHDREEDPKGYFQYLNKAYAIDKRHPLVLLHLAEHFLLRKDLGKCEKLCQLGLTSLQKRMVRAGKGNEEQGRNDYEDMKNRFNSMLGQANHIRGNYPEAIRQYAMASGKGLHYNDLLLAQCYTHPLTANYTEAIKLIQDCHRNATKQEARTLNDSFRLLGYLKSKVPRTKDDKPPEQYYTEALKFNRLDFQSKIEYANLLVESSKLRALRLLEQAEKIQLNLGNQTRPELLNNISVLHLENQESDICLKKLKKCLQLLSGSGANEQDQIRLRGLQLIVRFNLGICMERRGYWQSAKSIYEDILQKNPYYIDAAIRLAYVWLYLGNFSKMNQVLKQTDQKVEPYRRTIRPERFIASKAYLQHLAGSSSDAKQTLKQLGKGKDVYSTLLELNINYQGIMRKGVEMNVLKQFLRPSREFCYKFCKQDHAATFGYMLLAIICLVDKKFTKSQGLQFFNSLKQFSVQEIPSILYNMGLFLMNYDDHEHSILVLTLFRDRTANCIVSDELIALNHLLDNQAQQAQDLVKRNILRDPTNLKFRLQHAYLLERKSQVYYQKGSFKKKEVEIRLKQLRFCISTYNFLGRVSISDFIRGIECPQLKERVKNLYIKAKSTGQQRKFYIRSYIDSFEKVLKDLTDQENKLLRQERELAANKAKQESQRGLMQLLEEQQESEDEQTKLRKEFQRKRQRALEIARKRQQQIDSAWGNLKAMDQEIQHQKKSRKRGPRQPNQTNAPTRQKKRKPKDQELQEELSPQGLPEDQNSFQEEEVDEEEVEYDSEPHKKHKKEKKEKKHKKHKKHKKEKHERQRGSDESFEEGDKSQGDEEEESKEKDKKKQQEDDNEQLMKYML